MRTVRRVVIGRHSPAYLRGQSGAVFGILLRNRRTQAGLTQAGLDPTNERKSPMFTRADLRQKSTKSLEERTMHTKCARRLLAAAIAATVTLMPGHAFAATPMKFSAMVQEHYSLAPCGAAPTLCVHATGTGHASLLKKVTEVASVTFNYTKALSDGCIPEVRKTTLSAPNGDRIFMHATGVGCGTPNQGTSGDTYVVTGGTGRFAGARGTGSDAGIHTLTGRSVGVAVTIYRGSLTLSAAQ